MDEMAQKRLKMELEREKKEKEKKEEMERNRTTRPPPVSPRENTFDNKTAASWRTNKPAPAPVRKEEKPKKQFVKDEEGFISKGRAWERQEKPQDTQNPPPKQSSTATKKPEPNIDSNNIYASLVDD